MQLADTSTILLRCDSGIQLQSGNVKGDNAVYARGNEITVACYKFNSVDITSPHAAARTAAGNRFS